MEDAEAKAGTENRAGDVGRLTAHPIGAAAAEAVGGPVTVGPAPTEEESHNDFRYTPSHFTGAHRLRWWEAQ